MNHPRILKPTLRDSGEPETLVFKRWTNKKWAVLASFHKLIVIGTLCFSYTILGQEPSEGGGDSTIVVMSLELEEVEALGSAPFELESITLKPLTVVSRQDILSAPAFSTDELLEYVQGVDIRQRGKYGTQADLNIQGGTFDQSMVLLNGINLSDPQTGHFHLNLPVDLSGIYRVEAVSGSAARQFGTHAFSGAVNFVTRPPDSTGLNLGFRYGQHQLYKAYVNASVSGRYLSAMASVSSSGSDGYRENTDFGSKHAYIHAASKAGKLKAELMLGLNSRAFGANAFYSPRYVNQYEETSTGMAALKLIGQRPRSSYTLNTYTRINKDFFLLDRFDPAFYRNDHLTRVFGADLKGRFSSGAGMTTSSLRFRKETILSTSLGEPLGQGSIGTGRDGIELTNGSGRNLFNWSINHTLKKGLVSLDGGFLIHINSHLGFTPALLPGVEFRFQLPHDFQIVSSLNRSMRLPTFTDLYYQGPTNVGNSELEPEKANTFELGVFRKGRIVRISANGYFRQGRNLIDWIWMEDEKWHTLNLSEIDALGGDLFLEFTPENVPDLLFSFEKWKLSYSYTKLTRVSDQVISRYLLDNLKHKLVLSSDMALGRKLSLSLRLMFQDRNGSFLSYDSTRDVSREQAYEPFLLLDSKLSYSIGKLHIYLESTNLMNVDYYDIGNVPQAGRWTLFGMEIRGL